MHPLPPHHCDPDAPNQAPQAACRACEGTGSVRFIKFQGRWRSRVEIARWLLAQPSWRGAQVRYLEESLYLRLGAALMRLDGFTAADLI